MSGKEPFHREKTKAGVFIAISADKKCERAHHPGWEADDLLWEFISQCWDPEPKSRPNVLQVIHEVRYVNNPRRPNFADATALSHQLVGCGRI